MKRLMLVLLLMMSVFASLLLFPEAAGQPVRIELLGWLFETRTGMFVLFLCVLWLTYWLLKKLLLISVNSPQQLWHNLRSGSNKRRETRLKEAVEVWIDTGAGHSHKLLKRSKGVVPPWLHESLQVWLNPPQQAHDEQDQPLHIALKARLATDTAHIQQLSLSERQHYLDAWLAVHPAAPLALQRKADLLGDLGEFTEQIALYEKLWDKQKDVNNLKASYARALCAAAKNNGEQALPYLRKAQRLDASNHEVTIDLATALGHAGDVKSASKMLLDALLLHDHINLAQAALKLCSASPLHYFKHVDKPGYLQTKAGSWLRVCLAHQANLTGLAEDGLQALLEQTPSALLWNTQGLWYSEDKAWEKAVFCYQQASLYAAGEE